MSPQPAIRLPEIAGIATYKWAESSVLDPSPRDATHGDTLVSRLSWPTIHKALPPGAPEVRREERESILYVLVVISSVSAGSPSSASVTATSTSGGSTEMNIVGLSDKKV